MRPTFLSLCLPTLAFALLCLTIPRQVPPIQPPTMDPSTKPATDEKQPQPAATSPPKDNPDRPIHLAAQKCREGLIECLKLKQPSGEEKWAENRLADFTSWAVAYGAFDIPQGWSSADDRLSRGGQEQELERKLVVSLLEQLEGRIEDCCNLGGGMYNTCIRAPVPFSFPLPILSLLLFLPVLIALTHPV